jgi:hypothetical protein
MPALKWIVLALALFQGAWLTFDGSRALIVGDYVTPKSGARAGELGPWSDLVSRVGLAPRSRLIKCVHVFLGLLWLMAFVSAFYDPASSWWILLGSAAATLWYLPIGTVASTIIIVLLLTPQMRSWS